MDLDGVAVEENIQTGRFKEDAGPVREDGRESTKLAHDLDGIDEVIPIGFLDPRYDN